VKEGEGNKERKGKGGRGMEGSFFSVTIFLLDSYTTGS